MLRYGPLPAERDDFYAALGTNAEPIEPSRGYHLFGSCHINTAMFPFQTKRMPQGERAVPRRTSTVSLARTPAILSLYPAINHVYGQRWNPRPPTRAATRTVRPSRVKRRYIPAVSAHASLFAGTAGGQDDRWHRTGIIRYERFADFRTLIEHPDYVTKALPHRLASLGEARLVLTTELSA